MKLKFFVWPLAVLTFMPSSLGWAAPAKSRTELAADATGRARAAIAREDWRGAVTDAVMAATLDPNRLTRTMAALTLVHVGSLREAADWLRATEGGSDTPTGELRELIRLLQAKVGQVTPSLERCPRRLPVADAVVLVRVLPNGTAVESRLRQMVCVRMLIQQPLPATARVRQDGREVDAERDGAYLMRVGRFELIAEGRAPVPLDLTGPEGAEVKVDLAKNPALQGSLVLRSLPPAPEVLLAGARQKLGEPPSVAVQPGVQQSLEIRAPGRATFREVVTLGVGETRELRVRAGLAKPGAPLALALTGLGVAAASGAGMYFLGFAPVAQAMDAQIFDPRTGREAGTGYEQRLSTVRDANRNISISGAGIGLGATLMVTGLIWRAAFDDTPPEWK